MKEPVDAALLERARELGSGPRRLLGITGPPGAGKSTLAAAVAAALGERAVLVPMDGFHLAQAELVRLGRADRKGAPDTFDAAGFVALLARLRRAGGSGGDETVYAPTFDRALEEPVAGAIPVGPHVPLVVVEGNYLLHDDGPWARVAPLLDEAWYVEVDDDVRRERLVARHVAFGKEPAAARAWTLGPDERNARLIAAGRGRADRVARL
ncbi:nucleoside/nucleotide kinase family protein [Actinotalea ferrariae]|uniref:nucleoside/nucleotide kinase family protein n=1 Tax=Actinotalea ferrariae TaxID=1386098 RepID=UPI001C8B7CF8|nr:nucleoside/nucleotide kinase family protein [Actinotalea ferrariae]MBX9246994.1 nucleoside/nucleotide kinase family protein [Actinotalea ferrariae]